MGPSILMVMNWFISSRVQMGFFKIPLQSLLSSTIIQFRYNTILNAKAMVLYMSSEKNSRTSLEQWAISIAAPIKLPTFSLWPSQIRTRWSLTIRHSRLKHPQLSIQEIRLLLDLTLMALLQVGWVVFRLQYLIGMKNNF